MRGIRSSTGHYGCPMMVVVVLMNAPLQNFASGKQCHLSQGVNTSTMFLRVAS